MAEETWAGKWARAIRLFLSRNIPGEREGQRPLASVGFATQIRGALRSMSCPLRALSAKLLAQKATLRIKERMSQSDTDKPCTTAHLLPSTGRSLPIAMLRGREAIMAPYRQMLSKIGVTEQQWRVMRVLDERGRMDPKEIAEAACLLNPSLTRIMQLLEKKGLIARKGNPEDRRRVHVEITAAGRDMLVAAQPESLEIAEKLRARVGQDKLDELLDLLNSLAENGLE